MTITFVSNYINHHQIPFSDAMYGLYGVEYCFIQTEPMEEERARMGWGADLAALPYVKLFYEYPKECAGLILSSDAVIFGGVEDESYILPRLESGKLTLRYSERIYRSGQWKFLSPKGLVKKYHDHVRYRKSPVFLLCAGAYVASDFSLIHAYPKKKICWGYFPFVKLQDRAALGRKKGANAVPVILWAGRLLPLKHPETALAVARQLA